MSDLMHLAGAGGNLPSVANAWLELHHHPALRWVPPVWRHARDDERVETHAISAVERNLIVQVFIDGESSTCIRLSTGPLHDREIGDGIDPTTPAASIDPALTVVAASFEQAILDLRDAVVRTYGPIE